MAIEHDDHKTTDGLVRVCRAITNRTHDYPTHTVLYSRSAETKNTAAQDAVLQLARLLSAGRSVGYNLESTVDLYRTMRLPVNLTPLQAGRRLDVVIDTLETLPTHFSMNTYRARSQRVARLVAVGMHACLAQIEQDVWALSDTTIISALPDVSDEIQTAQSFLLPTFLEAPPQEI